MSSNRLMYDTCAYKERIDESVSPLAYVTNPIKYENCNKCRMELGIVGGSNVSNIRGNLVDLENDLRGQTRSLSQCPSRKYNPNNVCNNKMVVQGNNCGNPVEIDVTPMHLPPCQMIHYKPIPLPNMNQPAACPGPSMGAPNACGNVSTQPICS